MPDTDLNSTYIVVNETQALLSRGSDNKQVNKRPSVSDKHSGEKKAAAGTEETVGGGAALHERGGLPDTVSPH